MTVRRAAAVALLLAAGALAAPAGAAPARPALAPALDLPPGAVALLGPGGALRPQHRPLDALLSVRDHRDTSAWLRSLAAASEAGGSTEAVALLPDAASSTPAGDLDGDGREDVLTYARRGRGGELQARRGADGAPLWSRPLAGDDGVLAFPLARDLTGDGVDDLVVDDLVLQELSSQGSTGLTSGSSRFAVRYEHRLAVVSGRDGALVWQRVRPGRIEETYEYSGAPARLVEQGEYRLRATGLALLVRDTDDVDGDRLPDLVVNEVDLRRDADVTSATVVVDETSVERSTTRAAVLRGADGRPALERTASDVAGLALLAPLGQVTGGPAAELLWETRSAADRHARCVALAGCLDDAPGPSAGLELLDPERPGAPVWRSTVAGVPFVLPAGADLDGDAVPDVLRERYDGATDRGVLEVLSAVDGRVLWTAEDAVFPPLLVAVQDGLAVTATFAADDEPELLLTRRDAATGAVRSTERVAVRRAPRPSDGDPDGSASTFTGIYVAEVPDGDGDGRRELLVGGVSQTTVFGDTPEQDRRRFASQWRYAPLPGGPALLDASSDDLRTVLPTGDLDGDGAQDVRVDVLELQPGRVLAESTAQPLTGGAVLWRTSGPYDGRPLPAGDQDGQPGDELLQDVPGADGPSVDSRAGADLGLRWRAYPAVTAATTAG